MKPNTEKVPTGVKTNTNAVSLGLGVTVREVGQTWFRRTTQRGCR